MGIEACDAQIEAWAKSAAGDGVAVSLADSPAIAGHRPSVQPMVEIVLLDMQPNLGDDAPKKAVLRATLRYLVTVRADEVRVAHGILSKLLFAAMEHEAYEVERDVPWLSIWPAMATAMRPAFLIRTMAQTPREVRPRAKAPVKGLRVLEFVLPSPGSTFQGVVLRHSGGSAAAPAAGVVVDCAEVNVQCVTDANGFFDLGVLPPWPPRKRIKVTSGESTWQFEVDVSHATNASQEKRLTLEIGVS